MLHIRLFVTQRSDPCKLFGKGQKITWEVTTRYLLQSRVFTPYSTEPSERGLGPWAELQALVWHVWDPFSPSGPHVHTKVKEKKTEAYYQVQLHANTQKKWTISFKWARCSSQEGLIIKLADSSIKTVVKTETDHEKLLYNCYHLWGFQGKQGHYKPYQEVKCLHTLSLFQMQTHRGALSLVAQSHSNESALVSPAALP